MTLMKRCRASLSLTGSWGTEHLWPGLEVNLERELKPGYTVADAVAGREDLFDDIEPTTATAPKTPKMPAAEPLKE